MKIVYTLILMAFLPLIASANDASVTFANYNPEQISDVKNTFFSADGTYYYSEYVADNNMWHVRNVSSPGVDTVLQMPGVRTCERLVEGGGYRFAVTATGWLYRSNTGDTSWYRVTLPSSDFQTDNVFYFGSRLFLFPRFGRVWYSDNNGDSWVMAGNLGASDNYFYGIPTDSAIYVIGSTTLWYSYDQGNTWAYNFPPTGLTAFTDYALNDTTLYLASSTNTVYKVNGELFDSVTTAPGQIYGMTFKDSSNLFMFLNKGLYNYSLETRKYSLVFGYDKEIPLSTSNVLKSRVAKNGEIIRFALPPNEIIESCDGGNTWHYTKFCLKNSVVGNLCADSAEIACTVGTRLLKSNIANKVWYEVVFPQFAGNVSTMDFDNAGTLLVGFANNQLAEIRRGTDTATIDELPAEYTYIYNFGIDHYNELFAITSAGLAKSNSDRTNWSILNSAITGGTAKVVDNSFYNIDNGIIYRFDYFYNVLDSIMVINNGTLVEINGFVKFSDTEFYLSTNNGIYKYNPSAENKYERMKDGIISNQILQIDNCNSQLFALDKQSNVYASDSVHSRFGIYNPQSLTSGISQIVINNQDNVYLATSGSGVWIADKNDVATIADDYYWKYRDGYLEHSRITGTGDFFEMSKSGGDVFASGIDVAGNGFFAFYDVFTGRMNEGFLLDGYNFAGTDSTKSEFVSGMSADENYLATAFLNKNVMPQNDSIAVIDVNHNVLLHNIGYGFDSRENTFDSCLSKLLLIKNNTDDLFIAANYAVHDSLGNYFIYPMLKRYNLISGKVVAEYQTSGDSNSVITSINSLRNGNRIAVSLQNKGGYSSTHIVNLDSATSYEVVNFASDSKIQKVLSTAGDAKLICVFGNGILSYNVAGQTYIGKDSIKVYDAAFSGDSVSLIVCYSQTDSKGSETSYLAYYDINTMEMLEYSQIGNETTGELAIDPVNKKILVYGKDGIIRAYPDTRSADTLIADFTLSKYVVEVGNVISFNNVSSGTPQLYQWDFGDGNVSLEQNPTHYYTDPGIYTVSLEVTKNMVSSVKVKTNIIKVLSGLAIDFAADKTDGFKPMTVNFTENATSTVKTRLWKFGDGKESTEENPAHVYETAGKFTVGLYISNGVTADSLVKTEYINVDTVPDKFITDFSADVTSGTLPLEVQFSSATIPSATYWNWNFGDGGVSYEQNPKHTYTDYGNYTVTLTAGKEYKSAKISKKRYIRISRGSLEPLIVIDEIENKFGNSEREGLSVATSTDNFAGFAVRVDSSDSTWGELAVYNTANQELDYYNLALCGTDPTPRFISSATNNVYTLITANKIKEYNNLKVMKYNSYGENTMNFTDRKNINVMPRASITDGNDIIVASTGNDTSLMVTAFTTNTEYIFDKEYGSYNFLNPKIQLCSNWNNYILAFKESDTSKVKILTLSRTGAAESVKELFKDPYYYVSDIYSDYELNIIVSGTYRFSESLEPVYSFVAKYDKNLNQIFFTKLENMQADLKSVTETLTPRKEKRFVAAGSIAGNAGFFSFDINGNLLDQWKLSNRMGWINDIVMTKGGKMILTGTTYNNANKKDFYSLILSADNYYSTVSEDANINANTLRIYPNPSDGLINLQLTNAYNSLKITDASGRTVYEEIGEVFSSRQYDFTGLSAGSYILTVSDGNTFKTGKMVIVK